MLAFEVRFLHGTLRAASDAGVGVTGLEAAGEWPPSPARLFSALVSADGTGPRCRVTDGSELMLLEAAAPPVIHADPGHRVLRTPLAERFVVEDRRAVGMTQNYPARRNTLDRPGTRLAPFEPRCVYVWEDLMPSERQRRALRLRAARIGYLGAADAPAVVRMVDVLPGDLPPAWVVKAGDGVSLSVPSAGLLRLLDEAHSDFVEGRQTNRSWLPIRRVTYCSPGAAASTTMAAETVWLRFDVAVPDHHVLAVAETLREAVLSHYPFQDAPAVLHGHGMTGRRWHQARYLPLVEVGHPFASGRIHGAAVWLPPDTPEEVRAGVRTAVVAIRELVARGRFRIGVGLHGGAARPWTAKPARWQGPATRWVSATPVVHERHGQVNDAEIARWCANAGIADVPVRWRTHRHPLTVGAVVLRRDAVHRRYPGAPYSHVALEFERPLTGPLAIGRGRQFGLGLLAPDRSRDD